MRRILSVLVGVLLAISFSSCGNVRRYVKQDNIHLNYNNISADNAYYWLTEDALYYSHAPFLTLRYYAMTPQGRKTITSAEQGAFAQIQAYGNTLYMLDFHENYKGVSNYRLHTYDLTDGSKNEIGFIESVRSYFALDDWIFYTQENVAEDELVTALKAISSDGQKTLTVADSILAAGTVDNQPVYLKREGNAFSFYAYDTTQGQSILRSSFVLDLSAGAYLTPFYNFTSRYVVMATTHDENSKLVCYDIETTQLTEYPIDRFIDSAIVYNEYAFIVVVDEYMDDTAQHENTVYRFRLADGHIEKITELNGMVFTFVASDEYVYISSLLDDDIYRFDASGEKTLVCDF